LRMRTWIIVLCALLTSCELTRIVDVDPGPSKLVINSLFVADSTWIVNIAQTRHILERDLIQVPEQFTMSVVSSSGSVFTFEEQVNRYQAREYRALQKPVAGETYTITLSAPGFATAQAITVVPSKVELIAASLDSANMIPSNYDNGGSIPIDFTFQDPPGRGDYYIPQFVIRDEYSRYNPVTRELESVYSWRGFRLTEGVRMGGLSIEEDVRVISDEFFDGQLKTIRLHINKTFYSSNEPKTYPWRFYLTHIGEDYYQYLISSSLQRETSNNPLAQPVQVFSNIDGGLGIFAGASTSTWKSP
jgi:hypothetical protein